MPADGHQKRLRRDGPKQSALARLFGMLKPPPMTRGASGSATSNGRPKRPQGGHFFSDGYSGASMPRLNLNPLPAIGLAFPRCSSLLGKSAVRSMMNRQLARIAEPDPS